MIRLKSKKNNKVYFNFLIFSLFIFFLPTQLGKHFFLPFSYLDGIRVDYLAPTIYLTDVIVFLMLIFNFQEVLNFFKNKKIIVLFFLFLINIFFAKNQLIAFYKFLKIIEFLIVFVLSKKILQIIKEKNFLIIVFFSSLIQFFLSFYQLVFKKSIQGIFYFFGERFFNISTIGIAKGEINGIQFLRPYGTFSHPNSLGGFFLLLYFFVLTNKRFDKYLFLKYLNLLIISFLVFLSFSRIAIFAYVILNIFYFIFNKKTKCFICWLAKIFIFLPFLFLSFQIKTDPLTLFKRIELIKNSLLIIKENFFLGVGLGNYLIAQKKFFSSFPLFFHQPVHNIFFLLIAELGVFIFLFFIIYFFLSFKKNIYLLLTIIITGFFDHYWLTLQQNFLLLAFVYGSSSIVFFIDKFKSSN